jgi:hypothetical protein
MTAGLPVRLPTGWRTLDGAGQCAAAAGAGAVVLCADVPADPGRSLDTLADELAAELAVMYDDAWVLDRERIRCRGGLAGVRLLATYLLDGRSFTAEHRFIAAADRCHVLSAVMPTEVFSAAWPDARRALDSFRLPARPGRLPAGPPQQAPSPVAALHVSVLAGPRPGDGWCVFAGNEASVALPGMAQPLRIPTSLVPGWIAALVDLGPRPRPAARGVLVTERATLDRLLGSHPLDEVPSVAARWERPLADLRANPHVRWQATGYDAANAPLGRLEFVDAGPAGLWLVKELDPRSSICELPASSAQASLAAVAPTEVWHWLTASVGSAGQGAPAGPTSRT